MTLSHRDFQEMLENLPGALIVTDPGGKIIEANEETLKLLGYEEDDLVGTYLEEIVSRDVPVFPTGNTESLAGREEPLETLFISNHGTEIRAKIQSKSVTIENEERLMISIREIPPRESEKKGMKKEGEGLRETEDDLPHYFNELGDAVFITKIGGENHGKILDVNPEAIKQTGYSREELVGMNIGEDLAIEPPDMGYEEVDEKLARDETVTFTEKKKSKDGEEYWTEVMVTPIDYKGEKASLSLNRDITERKEMEDKLKESEKKFRNYWENAPVGSFLLDENGNFRGVNPVVTEITGYSREKLLGMHFSEIITSEALDSAVEAFERLLNQGEMRTETTFLRKDGTERQMVVNAVEASKNRYLAFTLDVTKRKEAERKLERSKERLEAAMEAGNLAWWKMELPSGKVSFSDMKVEMLGYSPEKFEHYEDFTELIHPEEHDEAMSAMQAHLDGEKEKYEVEYRIRKKDGGYKWFRDVGSLSTDEGEQKVVTGVVVDIDERKEAELSLDVQRAKLKKLHDAVDRFQQCKSEDELFNVAVNATRNILDFDNCVFYRAEEDNLVPISATEDMELEGIPTLNLDEGLVGQTFQKSQSIMGDDLQKGERSCAIKSDLRGYLSVPMGNVGVFQAGSMEKGAFKEGDLELAEILAGHLYEEVKRISLEEKLQQQAIRDPLTGLYNRRYFNETLTKEVQQAERYDKPLAFLMIDINKFKEINDRYSHQTGDEVLQEVADLLKENFRDADTVVRYGGDEFLVMMPETNGGVTNALNRLKEELDRWNEQSDLLDFPLILAIGVSHWTPDQERDVEVALKEADKKMYEDKRENG